MNVTKFNVSSESSVKYDLGLRAYMLQIFNYMTLALIATGFAAILASSEAFMKSVYYTQDSQGAFGISPIGWVIQLAPLFLVFFISFRIRSLSLKTAQLTFWIYSLLVGLSLGPLFYAYTGESIARAFFITAAVFGAMSIYGYSTYRDLTSLGSFLIMGLVGIIIASLVNIFLQSSAVNFAVSILGVIIFTGLTAYDVQKIKNMYFYAARLDKDSAGKQAILSALTLYLDFINLFIMLLRLTGGRRD